LAFYKHVFFDRLKVSEEFLNEHGEVIREKLEFAAAEFNRVHGNMFAINMCLHAASSVILSNPDYLNETLGVLGSTPGLAGKDPTMVLTVIVLSRLIQWDASRAASEARNAKTKEARSRAEDYEANLATLRQGIAEINWIIGEEAMRIVGFE